MLSEYMSGALQPPIFYKDDIIAPNDFNENQQNDNDYIERILDQSNNNNKRIVLPNQLNEKQKPDEYDNYDDFPLKSLFREHQRPKYIVENIDNDEFDPRNNDANIYSQRLFKAEKPKYESGVYTEGGLLFSPSTFDSSNQREKSTFQLQQTKNIFFKE